MNLGFMGGNFLETFTFFFSQLGSALLPLENEILLAKATAVTCFMSSNLFNGDNVICLCIWKLVIYFSCSGWMKRNYYGSGKVHFFFALFFIWDYYTGICKHNYQLYYLLINLKTLPCNVFLVTISSALVVLTIYVWFFSITYS